MRVSNNCFELSSCIIGDTATRPYSWGRTPLPHERPHLADFCPFETVKCAFSFCQLLKISYFIRTVFDSIRFISFVLSRLFQLEVLLTTVPPPTPLRLSLCLCVPPHSQGKLVKYFSRQLSCKCKVALEERSAELEDFPRLGHWFRIVNLRKEVTQVKSPRWNLHRSEENCKSKLYIILTLLSLQPKLSTTSD